MLTWLRPFQHFVPPPEEVFKAPDLDFMDGFRTYGEYNYLRPGLISRIKAAHFEAALELTRDAFGKASVLDFGCADGVFLPSLARHFDRVVAVDRVPMFAEIAQRVVSSQALDNVQVVCNEKLGSDALQARLGGGRFDIAYCLEVLEHAGTPEALYPSKIEVMRQIFDLLVADGRLVVSVPTMVGLPFLAQRAALAGFGIFRESMTWGELLRAGVLRDTRALESRWDGGHLGFSHLRLEEAMASAFHIERRHSLGFQMIYVVRRSHGQPRGHAGG